MAKHIDILKFDWAGAAREAGKKVDAGYAATGRKPFGIKDLEANPSLRLAKPIAKNRIKKAKTTGEQTVTKRYDTVNFDWAGAARDAGKQVDAVIQRTGHKLLTVADLDANPSLRLAKPVETKGLSSVRPKKTGMAYGR
jgi:hypothetical protein